MSQIEVKNSIALAVEAASGGAQTVIYTEKGQPCIMNKIKAFTLDSVGLGTGLHPAFITSTGANLEHIYIGTYAASVSNGELVSDPNAAPSVGFTVDAFSNLANASGKGFHLMTNAEWAALLVQAYKLGVVPTGNTVNGVSDFDGTKGILANPKSLTDFRTINGSGAASWRHDKKYNGISDLVGNVYHHVTGVRYVGGELQFITNNQAALSATDTSATSTNWRALDATTGALIVPTFTGTVGANTYVATTANSVRLDYEKGASPTTIYTGGRFNNLFFGSGISEAAKNTLKALGIIPIDQNLPQLERARITGGNPSADEKLFLRGGAYNVGNISHLQTLRLSATRISTDANYGARLCYIPQ